MMSELQIYRVLKEDGFEFSEHVIEWLVDTPEGCSAHENTDLKLRPPSGYNTTYKRQIWGEPGATVSTTFAMISGCRNVHPIATRSITTREALRLQSFPDSFKVILIKFMQFIMIRNIIKGTASTFKKRYCVIGIDLF